MNKEIIRLLSSLNGEKTENTSNYLARPYVGDIGTIIEVDMATDISDATIYTFKVIKGDGSTTTWTPTIYNDNYLRYIVATDDFDVAGTYVLQPYLRFADWSGYGDTVFFKVYELWR